MGVLDPRGAMRRLGDLVRDQMLLDDAPMVIADMRYHFSKWPDVPVRLSNLPGDGVDWAVAKLLEQQGILTISDGGYGCCIVERENFHPDIVTRLGRLLGDSPG